MAVVTFTLTDFGLETLTDKSPRVIFTPSSAGVKGAQLFPTTPIVAIPDAAGNGSVTLESTDGVVPTVWYTVSIEHLQPGGKYTHYDVLNYRMFVPEQGGPIGSLPGAPLSPQSVLVSLDPPPPGYRGWWLYSPAQGQEMPLDDPLIGELRLVS